MFKDKFGDVTFTVKELIAELQEMPPNCPVYTEGCDCTGNVVRLSYETDGSILLCRSIGI